MNLAQLIIKKLNGNTSRDEEQFFNEWYNASENNKELFSRLIELHSRGVDIAELENLDAENVWSKVLQRYDSKRSKKIKYLSLRSVFKYAAVFIGLMVVAYGYYEYAIPKAQTLEQEADAITLELDNGEIRILSLDDEHTVTDAEGNFLGKKQGSKLDYKDAEANEKLTYNTLKIPYGKRFEITLSDGTTVHLNAGSSLRYPVKFPKDKKRQVFLKGEAFFDVMNGRADSFIVSTSEMDVTVSGTEFNVTAYLEDTFINTVLVEGAVSLSNTNDKQRSSIVQLEPGQKAEWDNSSGKATLEEVDTDIYTSWISGRLVIKNLPFKNIIKRLERHYNLKIENSYKELDTQVYTASFNGETIADVLGSFAENKKFNFEVNNRTVRISPP